MSSKCWRRSQKDEIFYKIRTWTSGLREVLLCAITSLLPPTYRPGGYLGSELKCVSSFVFIIPFSHSFSIFVPALFFFLFLFSTERFFVVNVSSTFWFIIIHFDYFFSVNVFLPFHDICCVCILALHQSKIDLSYRIRQLLQFICSFLPKEGLSLFPLYLFCFHTSFAFIESARKILFKPDDEICGFWFLQYR